MRSLTLLLTLAVAALAWLGVTHLLSGRPIPMPVVQAVVLDPYDHPLLAGYKAYRDALLSGDTATLQALADHREDYVAYRAARTLAERSDLEPALRSHYYQRVLELRPEDPLDKLDRRALLVAYGETAEAAGLLEQASWAFEQALPETQAVTGLKRVESDPYALANRFLRARQHRNALAALDGRTAPSIEAPAYRALGEYAQALDAYERWLAEVPSSSEALLGVAWMHYYLGNLEEAAARFEALDGASALYGRALVAYRQGDTDLAVSLLQQTDDPADLWRATSYLEAEARDREALPLYLELAESDSSYADDAAYRAYVLAERLSDDAARQVAYERVPAGSFFGLKLGKALTLPASSELAEVQPEAIETANALARIGDMDAAVGELRFALRETDVMAEQVALAEHLQLMGEFRQGQRLGSELLAAGVNDRRVWKLAYPQAFALRVGEEANRYGLEPALIWAVMRQESAFFPKALSTSNAQGLMQVIPSTWDWLAELQREAPGDPFDVDTNVRYGSFYLRWLLDYLDGDLELVIASYNRGQGYIKRLFEGAGVDGDKDELYREIDASETREYLQRVMVNYQVYQTLYPSLSLRP